MTYDYEYIFRRCDIFRIKVLVMVKQNSFFQSCKLYVKFKFFRLFQSAVCSCFLVQCTMYLYWNIDSLICFNGTALVAAVDMIKEHNKTNFLHV